MKLLHLKRRFYEARLTAYEAALRAMKRTFGAWNEAWTGFMFFYAKMLYCVFCQGVRADFEFCKEWPRKVKTITLYFCCNEFIRHSTLCVGGRLVLPCAFSSAEMLMLPFGVEPPCGLGSFFAAQKMRNVSIPQIQSYRSISFAPNFIWAKKMAPAPGFEPGTKWLTATYSTAELRRNILESILNTFNITWF